MINDHQVLRMRSLKDNKDVEVEVNFSDNEEVKDCAILKFKYNGTEFAVKQDDLLQIMLVIGTPKTQKSLLPVTYTNIKKMERLLMFEFVTTKAYKKGEKITIKAPWIDEVVNVEAAFAGQARKKNKPITSTGIVLPNSFKE